MKKRKAAKRFRAFIAVLCALTLAVTPAFPAWADYAPAGDDASLTTQDTSSGEMSASDQQLSGEIETGVANRAKARRIESFKLDGEYFYQSLGGDTNKPTLTLSTSKLQDIVKTNLLPDWSKVAASVFRDQAGQLVDLYGEQPNGGNMSQAGFDAYFNMNKGGSKYANETWSTYDLSSKLRQTYSSHAGDPGWDQLAVTGVRQVSGTNGARDLVGQALRDCQNNDGLSASDFIGVTENGSERLDALKDHTSTAFTNIVTAINCKGSSSDFDYVSFGIVFYDFEQVPVAANGLKYQMGGLHTETNQKGTNSSMISNSQQQDAVHSAALGDSITETDSTTISALASAKMSENIGANIGVSSTESSTETNFWADDDSFGTSESTSSETISMGANWGTAWEMAGSLGAEQGHSTSKQVSKAVETTIALPPHTATSLNQETTTTTYTQYYQQPVILNYKVALFAVSGDYYATSACGGMGAINPGRYDKQSLVIKFDTKSDSRPSYGCAATDDLYSRTVVNRSVGDYDTAGDRTYSTHSSRSDWRESKDINWDNVISTAKNYYGEAVAGDVNAANDADKGVARRNYFYETVGKLAVEQDKTSAEVSPLYPLYNLDHVTTPESKTKYVLYSNQSLDKKALAAEGYNRYGVPFYSFSTNSSKWGGWYRCDENGNLVNGDESLYNDDLVKIEDGDTLVVNPGGNRNKYGSSVYLIWRFNSNTKVKTGENAEQDLSALNPATSGLTADTPKKVPVVEIEVKNRGLDNPTVTASGSYIGYKGTPINLNDVFTYEVTDADDVVIDTPVRWETRGGVDGISVDGGTGVVTFTKAGEFKVRPYVYKNRGDGETAAQKVYPTEWLIVTATEHNLVHYDAKAPTDCTGGENYGWIEHYRCSEKACGHSSVKYFSDALGKNELSEDDVIIEPTGHDWGEWTTTKDVTAEAPGVQQRVCKNRSSHVETRNLYMVQFDTNKPADWALDPTAAPKAQTIVSGASVEVPAEPAVDGFKFEGWTTDKEGNNPYDFSSTVDSNFTLYAQWSRTNYTVASTAVVLSTGSDGQQKVIPATTCSVEITDGTPTTEADEDGYKYWYKEVVPGDTVTVKVNAQPEDKYSFSGSVEDIQAVPVNAEDWSTGELIMLEPVSGSSTQFTFTMPESDVAIAANFTQNKVTVTYDENLPAECKDQPIYVDGIAQPPYVTKGSFPAAMNETGSLVNGAYVPTGANAEPTLTLTTTTTTGTDTVYYTFGGWYTDAACTQLFLPRSKVAQDTTLYAKWITGQKGQHTVKYTLLYADNTTDSLSYKVEDGAVAYDPTEDLYALAGQDLAARYALQEDEATGSCWFTDNQYENAYDFETKVTSATVNDTTTDTLNLYAKVTDREYAVTYLDGEKQLGTQSVKYEETISADDAPAATKAGCTFKSWVTKDNAEWKFATDDTDVSEADKVKSDLLLYATYTIDVKFNADGHGTAPATQKLDSGAKAKKPADLMAAGYTFGGWYTDAACTTPYDFDTKVNESLTLYAKWTANAQEMYRLYNPNSGEHFYTANTSERDVLAQVGWQYEGVGWTAPTTSNTPVYRLYNPNEKLGDHHYTTSKAEYDNLVSLGWSGEGVGWYSDDAKGVALLREYNPNAYSSGMTGSHNYTSSRAEHNNLVSLGWQDEGVGWYGLAGSSSKLKSTNSQGLAAAVAQKGALL